jgi:hypothetical protein
MKEEILEHYGNHEQNKLIEKLLNDMLKDIRFNTEYNDYKKQRVYFNRDIYNKKYKNENVCHARIWNDHRGGRCSCRIKVNEVIEYDIEKHLCQRHSKIVRKTGGLLYFGTYLDPLPKKDLVRGTTANWYC